MSEAAATASEPAAPAESSARARMGILRRMSEVGLRMGERLDRQSEIAAQRAESAVLPQAVEAQSARRLDDMARAFAQVSRAVSISVALEDRIERGPQLPAQPHAGEPLGPKPVHPVPSESRLTARREEVQAGVREAIDACAPARIGELNRRLDDLLDRELAAVDAFLARPADEIIARLCARLGLEATERDRGLPPRVRPEDRTAGGTPAVLRGVALRRRKSPRLQASQDAADPSIPCRDQSLPERTAQGQAPIRGLPLRGAPAGRDLDPSEPASRLSRIGSRAGRDPGFSNRPPASKAAAPPPPLRGPPPSKTSTPPFRHPER